MPFGLKFKRTRRYEISSKNSFVVGVHMLDNSFLECTLTAESTGQECLDSIAQRVELVETQYFGLRYVNKKLQFWWVDLEKPLKKQLDKFAQATGQPMRLYFGVMCYITTAHKVKDDVARYQYYLQLKNDIVDGRIQLSPEQAIRLAAFSLQAEFGDHDFDRNSQDYFKDNLLFPKTITTKDENVMSELMSETLTAHINLQGVQPVKAEIQYMKEVQMMDGYGMEYYIAKNDSGKKLYLGTSYARMFARYLDVPSAVFYQWSDIARVSQTKKMLEIDTSKCSVQYQMEDTDSAKYFRRMALLLQKFFKSSVISPSSSLVDVNEYPDGEMLTQPDVQPTVLLQTDISEHLNESQSSLVYVPEQRYEQDLQSTPASTEEYHSHSEQSLETGYHDEQQAHPVDGSVVPNGGLVNATQHQGHRPPQSSSQPQIDQNYSNQPVVLPSYRPSPSYESVMQQRMTQQTIGQTMSHGLGSAEIYSQPSEGLAYSQPEIRQDLNQYSQESHYVNSVSVQDYNPHSVYANVYHDGNEYVQYRQGDRSSNLLMQPTYSSPELTTHCVPQQFNSESNMLGEPLPFHYKPPPPYPRGSSSTPDLAVQTGNVSNANVSPDLVSRKNLGISSLAMQSKLDKSLENLADAISDTVDMSSDGNNPQISITHAEFDDTASDYSNLTFLAKDTDSEREDTLSRTPQRSSSIQIKYVSPKKAPPHSASKAVAIHRESFRRQMIARVAPLSPGAEPTDDPSLNINVGPVVPSEMKGDDKSEVFKNLKQVDENLAKVDLLKEEDYIYKPGSILAGLKKAAMDMENDADSSQLGNLNGNSLDLISGHPQVEEDNSSTSDSEMYDTMKPRMGPLKIAAMNGLTMSRPMVLALMNDETRAPKDERRKLLETKLSENMVFKEFEQVPKKMPHFECQFARQPENECRNRFRDVLPYDNTRVKLCPRRDNSCGYINASHVRISVGEREWWYIATQAPLVNTTTDFWQMIWEHEVDVIAMLTAVYEQGRQKCYQYWPEEPGAQNKIVFGDFEVILQFCNSSLCYMTNRISIHHLPSKKERQVWHLQYTDWPDHGCPDDMYGFLGFLDEIESVQRLAESDEGSGKKSPVIVHCSAGVGRTGVVILTEVMKWCLEHNHEVDLPKTLTGIRQQRMHMVQTLGQYSFIHKTLIQYLKNSRLI
ncbi:hypothetical protein ScPMuIL_014547 [Solemya velum]